jgi:TRAP-type mannitol/chloroaromatic compound transport system permease small subunit
MAEPDAAPERLDAFEALLAPALGADAPPPTLMDRLALAVGGVAAWLFILAILISVYEVVMRYAFGSPSSWTLPTTTTLCLAGFALGGAYCMARREHIRISFVPDKLGPRGRWAGELLALCVGVFYLVGLVHAVWLDAKTSVLKFDFSGAWSPELTPGPPHWPLPTIGKLALLAGAALFLAVVAAHLIRHLGRSPSRPKG